MNLKYSLESSQVMFVSLKSTFDKLKYSETIHFNFNNTCNTLCPFLRNHIFFRFCKRFADTQVHGTSCFITNLSELHSTLCHPVCLLLLKLIYKLKRILDKLNRIFFRNNYDVACPMNFRKYPYDTQICKVKYESCK